MTKGIEITLRIISTLAVLIILFIVVVLIFDDGNLTLITIIWLFGSCATLFISYKKLNGTEINTSSELSIPTKINNLVSNYDQYKNLTEKKDWAGICNLNGVDINSSKLGTKKEMNRLAEQLQPGEVVFSFTAGVMSNTNDSNSTDFGISTWLVVLTDRRFLFLDAAMLTSSLDVHSILHKNVQAVRVAQGFVLGKINIDTGGRSTLIDNCEKKTVKVLGDLSNEWLQVLEESKSTPQEHAATPVESGLDKLKKLGELKDLGLVTEQDFNDAKTKILASL